jgi:hypothetical protein
MPEGVAARLVGGGVYSVIAFLFALALSLCTPLKKQDKSSAERGETPSER